MIKIFSIHFLSLLAIPLIFLPKNHEYLLKFTSKVFTTMMELPIFVLSIWLAITAYSLINNIGHIFSKQMIIGMLNNNSVSSNAASFQLSDILSMNFEYINVVKIYMLDGFMEISISIFSIYIIWNLIVTLHNLFFQMIEVQTANALDNSLEQMTQNKFAGKI